MYKFRLGLGHKGERNLRELCRLSALSLDDIGEWFFNGPTLHVDNDRIAVAAITVGYRPESIETRLSLEACEEEAWFAPFRDGLLRVLDSEAEWEQEAWLRVSSPRQPDRLLGYLLGEGV